MQGVTALRSGVWILEARERFGSHAMITRFDRYRM
jgi:hypothetical protein